MTSQRPHSVAELARRLGVSHSTVTRALRAADTTPAPPGTPPPPAPQTDDVGRAFYDPDAFVAWWPHRPDRRGRPRTRDTTSSMGPTPPTAVIDQPDRA